MNHTQNPHKVNNGQLNENYETFRKGTRLQVSETPKPDG